MKTATMILAAGILSASAAAHAQQSINMQPGASPMAPPMAGVDQATLMNSMALMQNMNGADLSLMLAEVTAKLKADSAMTSQQLNVARTDPKSDADLLQAKLDALQRLQAQTGASKDLLGPKPAAPALPAGMTQQQYQQLINAQQQEAKVFQQLVGQPPNPIIAMPMIVAMQQSRMMQDLVVKPTPQQGQARQQLDGMLQQGIRNPQQRQQAEQLFRQVQWQQPAAPGVALTPQQQAQLAAMVTPQHQALLTALTQAQDQLAAARAKHADAQKRLLGLQAQMSPLTIGVIAPQIIQAQRDIIDSQNAVNAAQQKVAQAQQQAVPALQAVSSQSALAAQMRAQRAQMTPAQLAEEKAQQEREAALLRKQQLLSAQQQLPLVQQQLKEAQEQIGVRQKAAAAQVEQLKADQQKQLEAAQANMARLQQQGASPQQMQAAGQQMGGLQRQQQQQMQGLQQQQFNDQQAQQKNIASLQQLAGSLQQQIAALQAQQAQTPAVPPEVQKVLDTMKTASTNQIDQIVQTLLAQTNTMTAAMNSQMKP